MTYENITLL